MGGEVEGNVLALLCQSQMASLPAPSFSTYAGNGRDNRHTPDKTDRYDNPKLIGLIFPPVIKRDFAKNIPTGSWKTGMLNRWSFPGS